MAYSFNGTSQYLSVSSAVVSGQPFSFAAWANTSIASPDVHTLSIHRKTGNTRFALNIGGGNNVRFFVRDDTGTGDIATGPTTYTTGSWAHTASKAASATSRFAYLNGAAGAEATGNYVPTALTETAVGVTYAANAYVAYMNGLIAEAAIWNVALTDAEITSLAKGFKPTRIRPQSLVFYAPLIRNIQDTRGGLAITNNNSATVANHPRVY